MGVSVKRQLEIERRVELTGDFFMSSECSFREIAEIFSNNPSKYFDASHVTIRDYINKYRNKHPELKEKIDYIININKGSTIKDDGVLNRIKNVYNLLSEGSNFEQISSILGESYWVVYYDIHLRLRKLDSKLYESAQIMIELNMRNKK